LVEIKVCGVFFFVFLFQISHLVKCRILKVRQVLAGYERVLFLLLFCSVFVFLIVVSSISTNSLNDSYTILGFFAENVVNLNLDILLWITMTPIEVDSSPNI